ncbi:MAG: DUF6089 family protein [Bacteroidales bacterium]
MIKHTTTGIIVILFLLTATTQAQKYEAGVFGGTSYYLGDLNPNPDRQFANAEFPAYGLFGRMNFTEHLSARLGIHRGTISGTDADSPYEILGPNTTYHFETDITELALQGEVNFLPYTAGDVESLFTPYLFGGISGFLFSPTAKVDNGTNVNPISGNTHWDPDEIANNIPNEYSPFDISYLFGFGLKYHITKHINGGFEWGLRHTYSKYLDEVHLKGNPKKNDWYSFAGISFTFRFKDKSCAVCPY